MFSHSTDTASFFSVLISARFLAPQAGVAVAQGNTSLGINALPNNTTGSQNTANGVNAQTTLLKHSIAKKACFAVVAALV
jgi:hypothetical protein